MAVKGNFQEGQAKRICLFTKSIQSHYRFGNAILSI
ncbi:Uncharacterised protein [Morganella morganii]|uniref:Uncharacterized protein n=1 Tax=Morganella morganii subsp. morganii KT TaxID=1124991 RepID=M1SF77_MORMO|nr:hypothetical protein MU9_1757 [Morganella morganii subsp. morganii KT]KJY05646.1 hypothetical protein Mm0Y_00987 [Morganella morganii]SGE08028.1 Uncharacterised protein [Mycobacterium tuberculosis]SSN06240.1 Uncharacterised protein [Klebsiella pneumoniae]SHM55853.1 hypothetical protein SAMN05216301_2555 [Morganella morganii]